MAHDVTNRMGSRGASPRHSHVPPSPPKARDARLSDIENVIKVHKEAVSNLVTFAHENYQCPVLDDEAFVRPVGTDLEFRINIPPSCAVYMSREILGDDSGNAQFQRFEHKHFKDGARISWVLEIENVDIEAIESSTCSAIEAASRRQDEMRLNLSGIFGGDKWDTSLYTGSASRDERFKPRECTTLAAGDTRHGCIGVMDSSSQPCQHKQC